MPTANYLRAKGLLPALEDVKAPTKAEQKALDKAAKVAEAEAAVVEAEAVEAEAQAE